MQWHYKKGDVWIGPISDEEKKRLIKIGVLTRDTLISVCHDSADFVPSNSSGNETSSCDLSDSDEKKENGKYYYYGVHSDSEERELELVAKECGADRISDNDEEDDENWRMTDDEEYWDEEEEEDEEETAWENDAESSEIVDEEEDSDDDIDEESEGIDDEEEEEDVLTVPSDDQWLFDTSDWANAKDSEEEFDELAVMPDSDIEDEEDESEREDASDVDDLSLLDDWNADCKQADTTLDLSRRLEEVERKLEQVSEDFGAFSTDNDSRLDSLEEQTGDLEENCEKLDADVKSLSVKSTEETDYWKFRFDEQAERVAIAQEKIAGIQRKIRGENEEKNRRLVDLEEKTGKYEVVNRELGSKVGFVETTIQNLEKSVLTLGTVAGQFDTLQKTQESLKSSYEKLNGDFNVLSTQVSTFDVSDWTFRLDEQSKNLALIREQVSGIDRQINTEVEEKNFRLNVLEKKTGKYAAANRELGSKVDSLETSIQNLGQSARTWTVVAGQLDALQKKLEALENTYEKLNADVKALSTQFSAFDVNSWNFRLDDQAEDLAIIREQIAGIENRNPRGEGKNPRLNVLEEKIRKYEATNRELSSKVDSLATMIQNMGQSVQTWTVVAGQLDTLQKKQETLESANEKLNADVKALVTQFTAFDVDDWNFRLDGYAKDLNVILEQIAEIESRIPGEGGEEKNSRLNVLEEKTGKYEVVNRELSSKVESLETNVRLLTEESIGTAFTGRINQLFTKFQEQNKETREEGRILKEYVDEQRQAIEKLAKEITQKIESFASQESSKRDEQEETMGTAFIGRITQLFTKFQKLIKEQEEERRRFKEELEEERRRFREELDELCRTIENSGNSSKKRWRFF